MFVGGYFLANLLIKNEHIIEKVSLGFLLNLGIFTFIWFVLNTVNVPYDSMSAFILILSLAVSYYLLNFVFKYPLKFVLKKSKLSKLDLFLSSLIVLLFVSSLLNNLYWPVKAWDSLALYDFRSIVFAETGHMIEGLSLGYFFQYPLFTSLFHTWARVNGFNNPMFIYSLLYISFLCVFYFSLRKNINKTRSLFWTFIAGSLPLIYEHSTIAYTNLPYSIFLVLSIIYFYRYVSNNKFSFILIPSIMLSVSAWTRYTEPFWIGVVLFVSVYLLYNRKFLDLLVYCLIFMVSRYTWVYYLRSIGLENFSIDSNLSLNLAEIIKSINLESIKVITNFVYENIFISWGISSLLFVVLSFKQIFMKKNSYPKLMALQIYILIMILLAGTFLFSFIFPGWGDIPDSATRMAMFYPILFIYYIALFSNL